MFKKRSRALVAIAGLALVGAPTLAGCSDEDSTAAAGGDRPVVTFTATDTELTVPAEVPSGFVDINLETEPGDVDVHHIFVARLHDGVTVDDILNGDDEAFFTKLTLKGGNGSIAAGEDVTMTLDLEPGNYFALDNPQNENSPTAAFTVVDSGSPGQRPEAEGVITMGPGMVIDVPEDFDGTGTWEFVNEDTVNNEINEVHEAALVKLTAGSTSDDLVDWFGGDHQTPPPIDGEFGSMGALGPGQRAWITIEPGEPGDYVLVCFVPGRDGIPHVMKGMVTPVTIG
jgi:hypothetical protein